MLPTAETHDTNIATGIDVVEKREAVMMIWRLAAPYLDSCAMTVAIISYARKAAAR